MPDRLADAPPTPLDARARPRTGAYRGWFDRVDLRPLAGRGVAGRLRHFARLKRWHFAFVASDEVLAGVAVVHLGYAAGGFVWAVERARGQLVLDRGLVVPAPFAVVNDRPGEGARASLDVPGVALRIERRSDRFQVLADLGRQGRLEAILDTRGAPPPLAVVTGAHGGGAHVTQKSGALPATGEVRVGTAAFALDGFGGLDYTQGHFPRATRWNWAYATGRAARGDPLALNLTDGLDDGGAVEDALLTDAGPSPLPPCTFSTPPDEPLGPWRVASADGAVELRFQPLALHRDERDLCVLRTRFVQVAGTFTGRVRGPRGPVDVSGLPGVCERQDVLW